MVGQHDDLDRLGRITKLNITMRMGILVRTDCASKSCGTRLSLAFLRLHIAQRTIFRSKAFRTSFVPSKSLDRPEASRTTTSTAFMARKAATSNSLRMKADHTLFEIRGCNASFGSMRATAYHRKFSLVLETPRSAAEHSPIRSPMLLWGWHKQTLRHKPSPCFRQSEVDFVLLISGKGRLLSGQIGIMLWPEFAYQVREKKRLLRVLAPLAQQEQNFAPNSSGSMARRTCASGMI